MHHNANRFQNCVLIPTNGIYYYNENISPIGTNVKEKMRNVDYCFSTDAIEDTFREKLAPQTKAVSYDALTVRLFEQMKPKDNL